MGKHKFLFAAWAAGFSGCLWADAFTGEVEKQATNWTAVVMFFYFRRRNAVDYQVGGEEKPLVQRLLHRRRRHHRLSERAGDCGRLYVGSVFPRHFRHGVHARV